MMVRFRLGSRFARCVYWRIRDQGAPHVTHFTLVRSAEERLGMATRRLGGLGRQPHSCGNHRRRDARAPRPLTCPRRRLRRTVSSPPTRRSGTARR
jgi:hypothetical protein